MRYLPYELESQNSYSFFQEGDEQNSESLEADARLIWSVEASSWDEANQLKHEFLGWEPYKPFDR